MYNIPTCCIMMNLWTDILLASRKEIICISEERSEMRKIHLNNCSI